jgi:hypothetical protein
MVVEAVRRIKYGGDAPLGISAVGLLEPFLGNHQASQARINGQGGSQTGQAASNDQNVGEEMRDLLRMKWGEIAGTGEWHGRW